eukprot:scaffold232573_cov39-Tisochrysis_lutea.AAC.1
MHQRAKPRFTYDRTKTARPSRHKACKLRPCLEGVGGSSPTAGERWREGGARALPMSEPSMQMAEREGD